MVNELARAINGSWSTTKITANAGVIVAIFDVRSHMTDSVPNTPPTRSRSTHPRRRLPRSQTSFHGMTSSSTRCYLCTVASSDYIDLNIATGETALHTHCFIKTRVFVLSCKWAVQLVVNVSALNDGVIDTRKLICLTGLTVACV